MGDGRELVDWFLQLCGSENTIEEITFFFFSINKKNQYIV